MVLGRLIQLHGAQQPATAFLLFFQYQPVSTIHHEPITNLQPMLTMMNHDFPGNQYQPMLTMMNHHFPCTTQQPFTTSKCRAWRHRRTLPRARSAWRGTPKPTPSPSSGGTATCGTERCSAHWVWSAVAIAVS